MIVALLFPNEQCHSTEGRVLLVFTRFVPIICYCRDNMQGQYANL